MEKKKLLFVAISVGLFLAFTIGAAILIFTPMQTAPGPGVIAGIQPEPGITVPPAQPVIPPIVNVQPPVVYTGIPQPVDAVGLVRGNEEMPGIRPLPDGAAVQADPFHVQGQPPRPPVTVITVPQPTRAAVPVTPPAAQAAPRPAPAAPPPRPPAQAAPVQQAAPPPVAALPRPAPAVAQPRPAPPVRGHFNYWIQTGAFSTVTNAEGVREALSSKGIASIIDNSLIGGRYLFRVRVGPYTSVNEANYWLALIQSIDGFEDSQVRQTRRP